MTQFLNSRTSTVVWRVTRNALCGAGRFLWRSAYAPATLGAVTTLALWQRTLLDAMFALGWGALVYLFWDVLRSTFGTSAAQPPAPAGSAPTPQTTPPSAANQQLARAPSALSPVIPNSTAGPSTPPSHTADVCLKEFAEPPPLPTDGLSWMNVTWVAGPICRNPSFTTFAGGGARLAICVATQEYSDDRFTSDSRICFEYHWVVLWDELAKRYRGQLKNGVEVIAIGSSRTRTWKDKQGTGRVVTELHAKMLWVALPWELPGTDEAQSALRKPSLRPPAKPLFVRPKVRDVRPTTDRAGHEHSAPLTTTDIRRDPQ